MRIIFVVLLYLTCQTQASSQTLSVRCKFSDGQITNFDKNTPDTKREKAFVELVFDQIDINKKTARLIGNSGVENVQAIKGDESKHLIEFTGTGNMNITTIYTMDKFKNLGTFPVVHSRHLKIGSSPLPSQYVGTCKELLQ